MNENFKGVWIPAEVYLDDRLTTTEKILFAEICSLGQQKGCFASNEHFAKFLKVKSISKVSKMISKLVKLGYVSRQSFDGRKRILQVCIAQKGKSALPKRASLHCPKGEHSNTISKSISNTVSKPPISPKGESEGVQKKSSKNFVKGNVADKLSKKQKEIEFNKFWGIYPKKAAKKYALQAWMKIDLTDELIKKIHLSVEKAKLSKAWLKEEGQYIPHPSTWLNQGRWDDEISDVIETNEGKTAETAAKPPERREPTQEELELAEKEAKTMLGF